MGHTYKDARDHFDGHATNRYFRKMDHNKQANIKKNLSRCGVTGKASFPSHADAQTRANEILAGNNVRDGISSFRIYKCEHCRLWHMTKQR